MELYTLVSLIIGIFGATYAALNALRVNFEGDIKTAVASADARLEAIVAIRGEGNSPTICKRHKDKICSSGRMWTAANAIPAIVFFIAILSVGTWVLYYWNEVTIQHVNREQLAVIHATPPWCWFRCGLSILGIINIACVALAIIAWVKCKNSNGRLDEHFRTLKDKPLAGLENPN